jgi:N-acetylmuramoyl-L-alanine amidase
MQWCAARLMSRATPLIPRGIAMKIAVDPRHGNSNRNSGVFDPGAEHLSHGFKSQEADIALRYGLALKDVLRARHVDIFMTRENATDNAPMGQRAGNAAAPAERIPGRVQGMSGDGACG